MKGHRRVRRRAGSALACGLLVLLVQTGTAGAALRPAFYADSSTPTATVVSYYNAIDRGEYGRAYGYILPSTRPAFHHFTSGYGDTALVKLSRVWVAGYTAVSSMSAAMCVRVRFVTVSHERKRTQYRGWYIVESTTGQEPDFGGWKINLTASRLFAVKNGVPLTEHCKVI